MSRQLFHSMASPEQRGMWKMINIYHKKIMFLQYCQFSVGFVIIQLYSTVYDSLKLFNILSHYVIFITNERHTNQQHMLY